MEDKLSSMEEEISSKTFPIQESLNNAEASLRNQRKKIEDLQDALLRCQAENEALSEKIAELEAIKQESPDDPSFMDSIDPMKKYLFIINDEKMRYKIKAWFPNSVISEKLEITPKNSSSFYMAIFITKSIGHSEYFRIKKKCMVYGIPTNYYNQINYRLVCQSIAKCKEEYNLPD